ncbi:MAG: ATP-dependent helicase [Deltaproteobacteria bacterium]|uniref:DNA 3'-5' helicase n=1 Tax=Candidatus Zymogenus saltonus TaxID=2844893 RepID=A0A9D8PQB1_9DELT|nr:ATP-dependent helicase [Candidatus Zymogenus saltonus]
MKKYTIKRQPIEVDISSMSIDYAKLLNPAQLSAVTFGGGPSLIIAGAGSGKTRTLVYRVAYLVERGVKPASILLLTFTRKAAQEMLKRAAALTGSGIDSTSGGVEGGTFHSFASRTLREFAQEVGFSPSFTILDRSDSEDVINLIRGGMGLNVRERRFPKKKTIADIFSKSINRSIPMSEVVETEFPHFAKEIDQLYELLSGYTEYKQKHMLMDYDDLLVYLARLLKEKEPVAAKLRGRYAYILVDEYQDTNSLQADIVKYLAGENGNVMVVGDDSQSIYSFRGADFKNIMDFPKLFPKTKIVKLEENYRSTQSILDLANTIIDRAREKYTKVLYTKREKGGPPALVPLPDESTQSAFVAQKILELREEGVALTDIAVLFRAGFHSFDLEMELKRRNIPYVKYGGFKFMETAHVKDIMAHLKILTNPSDAVGLERALLLVDGVGPAAAREISEHVISEGVTSKGLSYFSGDRRYGEGIARLAGAISTLEESEMSPADAVSHLIDYYTPILKKRYDDYPKRLQDLEHLSVITGKYRDLDSFMTDMALEPPSDSVSDIAREDPDQERLILSTIHSAKGLEWHSVFIIWAAEGYFPTSYAADSVEDLEEELRLMYVAATRAEQNLFITYPVKIITHKGPTYGKASRFVMDIDEGVLETWVVEEEWDV